jgi:hypothetical protein
MGCSPALSPQYSGQFEKTIKWIVRHTGRPASNCHIGAEKLKTRVAVHYASPNLTPLIWLFRRERNLGLLPLQRSRNALAPYSDDVERFVLTFPRKIYGHSVVGDVKQPDLGQRSTPLRQCRFLLVWGNQCFHGFTNPVPFQITCCPFWINAVLPSKPVGRIAQRNPPLLLYCNGGLRLRLIRPTVLLWRNAHQ